MFCAVGRAGRLSDGLLFLLSPVSRWLVRRRVLVVCLEGRLVLQLMVRRREPVVCWGAHGKERLGRSGGVCVGSVAGWPP